MIALGFAFGWAIEGVFSMVLSNLLVAAVHLATPWMNRHGFINLSRYSLIFFLSSFLFIFSGMTGKDSGVHLIFYTITAFSCLVFDSREKLKLFFAVLYPVTLFSILIYTDFKVFPNWIPETGKGFNTVNHFSNFLLITMSLFFLFRTSEKMETDYQEVLEKHLKAQKLLDEERSRSIYSGRMAALGEMAGGIAHEINSPLSVITMISEQVIKRYPDDRMTKEQVLESAVKINNTANRIAEIVTSLRSISRTGDGLPFIESDVKDIIHETLVLCKERFRSKDIHLKFDIPTEISSVYCRQIEVSQVLLNLLNNACDALEGFPHPTIEISISHKDDKVLIGVADNGSGIDPSIREKILTPFFTTKDVGKGTGLGLSISKGLIEANNGQLFLDTSSTLTKFVIELSTTPNKRLLT